MFKNKSILIGLSFTLFIFIVIRYFLDFDGLYGQDSYEYLRYTNAIKNYIIFGVKPGDYFWPLYYPIIGAIFSIFGNTITVLQLISIISFVLTIIYTSKTIQLLYPKNNSAYIYTLLFLGLSPLAFRTSLLVMSDMLTGFFISICFYNALLYFKYLNSKNLYLLLCFGISAVMTRYAAFVVLFPLALYTIYFLFKSKKHLKHLILLLLVSFVLLLPHFIIRSNNSTDFLNHSWLQDWSLLNAFKSSFITVDGISNNSLPNILYAFSSIFHPRYFALGSIFLFILFKMKPKEKYQYLVIISYLFYGVFLSGIPFQNSRFLVLSFPLLIIILYPSFDYLSNKIIKPSIRHLTFVIIAIIQSILCFIAFQPVLERNRFEKKVTEKIEPYQNNTLYSFDIDIAMQGRGLNFNYMNLWVKEYKTFEKDALVLFHPTRFNKQWLDKNPILNWDNLNKNYNLKIIEELPEGWKLYRIENKK